MADSLHLAQVGPVWCSSLWRGVEMTEAMAGECIAELLV